MKMLLPDSIQLPQCVIPFLEIPYVMAHRVHCSTPVSRHRGIR